MSFIEQIDDADVSMFICAVETNDVINVKRRERGTASGEGFLRACHEIFSAFLQSADFFMPPTHL